MNHLLKPIKIVSIKASDLIDKEKFNYINNYGLVEEFEEKNTGDLYVIQNSVSNEIYQVGNENKIFDAKVFNSCYKNALMVNLQLTFDDAVEKQDKLLEKLKSKMYRYVRANIGKLKFVD